MWVSSTDGSLEVPSTAKTSLHLTALCCSNYVTSNLQRSLFNSGYQKQLIQPLNYMGRSLVNVKSLSEVFYNISTLLAQKSIWFS